MTSSRIVVTAAALVFLVAGLGGCPIPEELSSESGAPAGTGTGSGSVGEDAVAEETTTLASVATGVASGDMGSDVAWSSDYTSISIHNDHRPSQDYSAGHTPSSRGDSHGGDAFVDGDSDDSGEIDDSDSGDSDDSVEILDEEPCEDDFFPDRCYICPEWGGDYEGIIYAHVTETLEGYGGGSGVAKFCSVSMSFDDAGVPEWIPIPIFARSMTRVHVRSVGETKVYSYWVYRMTITVVSATYTPTTADVVLDIDLDFFGSSSAIRAAGVHTMHTEIDGDSLVYSSQTHYDGSFFAAAGDPDNPGEDWEPNATQDFDCSVTLRQP